MSEVFEEVLLGILGEERRIATIANSLEYLKQDFQSGNSFLQGYSLVYYRYLRPQLGIDSEKAAVLVGFAPRTIRRRLNDGTDHLSLDLVRREIELRRVIRISREMDVSRDDLAAAYQVIPASTHRKSNGKNASVRTLLD
ncbi:MAG TPA: hypothetical protein VJZ27_18725 [Aggregatilineales bacterium]|nr:hypothetical protein [Aggregatilineales bacterium]